MSASEGSAVAAEDGKGSSGAVEQQQQYLSLEERLNVILNSTPFSASDYLNTALEECGDDTNERTRTMTEIALKLQMETQACHEDIGKISAELNALLPRCYADISRIGKGLEGLQMDISGSSGAPSGEVQVGSTGKGTSLLSLMQTTNSSASDRQHSSSLETLGTLHALQVNLRRTHEILTAAATWDATLQNISLALSQNNVIPAVTLFKQLEKGANALKGMPDNEGVDERNATLVRVRTQILQLLQPQLQHALHNMTTRIAPLQQCVTLYQQLGSASMEKLVQEYVKIRPGQIHKLWFDFKPKLPASMLEESGGDSSEGPGAGGSTPSEDADHPFVEWLPGWYEAVLSLLGEERRQSQSIFGPAMVPEMTTKVLMECFRPILSSFKSRLEGICSSNTNPHFVPARSHSLQSLCTVYEQTLQFLALCYESVAGAWLDMIDASLIPVGGTSAGAAGGEGGTPGPVVTDLLIHQKMTSIFLQVTQPFRTYQEQLPLLEQKYSGRDMDVVEKEMQQIVSAVSPASSSGYDYEGGDGIGDRLQNAVEQLKSRAGVVFNVAQGAVARFELLNGGYGVSKALQAVDRIISNHAKTVADAVPVLHHGNGDSNRPIEQVPLDESNVFSALQVLQIAGLFRQDLRSLEGKTRERLAVLCSRTSSFMAREQEIQELERHDGTGAALSSAAVHRGSAASSKAFVLPEALSAVDIDSIVTKAICGSMLGGEEEISASLTVLQRLASMPSSPAQDDPAIGAALLFPGSEEAVKKLAHSCHVFVFDVCSAVPRHHLSGMSSLPTWKEQAGSAGDAFASYGTLPNPYITAVGEHILALVQALEPFAGDKSALAVANHVMSDIRDVAVPPWRELITAATVTSDIDEQVIFSLMDGKQLKDLVIGHGDSLEDEIEGEHTEDEDEDERAITVFCNAWLDVIGLAVTGRVLERIMRIPSLTPKGCEHLHADLTYLVNVLSALGVTGHPHPLLGHVAALATLDGAALSERIASHDNVRTHSNPALHAALSAMEERLAAIRGVAASYSY